MSLATEVKGAYIKSTFSEYCHVAYHIKGNEAYNNMLTSISPSYTHHWSCGCDQMVIFWLRIHPLFSTIALKDISSQTTDWIMTKTGRNDPYMALFNNCLIVLVCRISRSHRLKHKFSRWKLQKASCLKPEGLEPWYLVCSITL